ncbi:MAG: response regulator transcription factor [Ilumatobacteraceae bacterium]
MAPRRTPRGHDRHASCLRRADGTFGDTALVIEPAKPAEVAPIIVDAYDLSEREQHVTALITRGARTAEIAGELYLSVHTVRDHIKSIFRNVQVSSRGERFAEHYQPSYLQHAADVRHTRPR